MTVLRGTRVYCIMIIIEGENPSPALHTAYFLILIQRTVYLVIVALRTANC